MSTGGKKDQIAQQTAHPFEKRHPESISEGLCVILHGPVESS